MKPFEPRPLAFHGRHEQAGWGVKLYSVRHGDGPVDWPGFRPALEEAVASLPAPDESICVWDLEIAWHERQAWVGHMLAHRGPDRGAWWADTLGERA